MSNEYDSNEIQVIDEDYEPLKGTVKMLKPTLGDRLARIFFPSDVTSVKDYLFWEIFMPNLKQFMLKNINDAFDNTASQIYRSTSTKRRTSSNGSWFNDNVSFGDTSDLRRDTETTSSLDDIGRLCYSSKDEAYKARERIYGIAKSNKVASVFDLCRASRHVDPDTGETIDIEPKWNYNYYGWTPEDIARSTVKPYGAGYIITLPRAYDIRKYR